VKFFIWFFFFVVYQSVDIVACSADSLCIANVYLRFTYDIL
jgi:hypothetical protein